MATAGRSPDADGARLLAKLIPAPVRNIGVSAAALLFALLLTAALYLIIRMTQHIHDGPL